MVTLYLYSNLGFSKSENVALLGQNGASLGIELLLSKYHPVIMTDSSAFPRINIDGTMELNVALSEDNALLRKGDYLKIEVTGTPHDSISYYFVDSVQRRANNVAHLSLTLDVLNTFLPSFLPSTYINRTHRSRWSSWDYTEKSGIPFLMLADAIDPISEGITVNKYVSSRDDISSADGNKWYLIYRSNASDGVACSMVSAESQTIGRGGSARTLASVISSYLPSSDRLWRVFYVVPEYAGPVWSITSDGNVYSYANCLYAEIDVYGNSNVTVKVYAGTPDNYHLAYTDTSLKTTEVTINAALKLLYVANQSNNEYIGLSYGVVNYRASQNNFKTADVQIGSFKSYGIKDVDRTDTKLIKIIECPYAPVPVESGTNGITFADFTYNTSTHEWDKASLNTEFSNPLDPVALPGVARFAQPLHAKKGSSAILKDPKLLHSDYHSLTFVYDSFIQTIPLDGISIPDATKVPSLSITYKQSSAISSSLAYRFDFVNAEPGLEADAFNHYLVSTRSNEVPIFTNDYIAYIRTGYNYDIKNKNTTNAATWGSFAMSLVTTAATLAASTATGGAASGLFAVSAATTAVSFANAIRSTASAELSMDEKLESLRNKAASVSGANDLDLLNFYSGNKLQMVTFDPSQEIQTMLNVYFRYYGYAVNRQETPNLHARAYYTYLQCTPKFTPATRESFGSDAIESLYEACLESGVTFIDFYNLSTYGKYAAGDGILAKARDLENWELPIFSALPS